MTNGAFPTSLTVTDSQIVDNRSGNNGGAISVTGVDGPVNLTDSTLSGNTAAGFGGGLSFGYGAELTIDGSTFSGNSSTKGGGGIFAFAHNKAFTLRNSTISGNQSAAAGAGVNVYNGYDETVTILNSTISGNAATGPGGGLYRFGANDEDGAPDKPDELGLSGTIIAGNTSVGGGADIGQGPQATGSIRSNFSLIGTTAGGAALTEAQPGTNLFDVGDPGLGPLADNGGPTQTMLPLPTSQAIDAGIANGLSLDQRGAQRTLDLPAANAAGGDGTDIGATESGDGKLDGGRVTALRRQKQGRKVLISVRVGAAEDVTATASGVVTIGKGKALTLPGVGTEVAAGETSTLKLKPKGKAKRKIAKALARRKKPKAALKVVLADAAGNSTENTPVVILKR